MSNPSDNDFDLSQKNASIALLLGIFWGLILGSFGGGVVGFVMVGGLIGSLSGIGIGLIVGPIMGYGIAWINTPTPPARIPQEKILAQSSFDTGDDGYPTSHRRMPASFHPVEGDKKSISSPTVTINKRHPVNAGGGSAWHHVEYLAEISTEETDTSRLEEPALR